MATHKPVEVQELFGDLEPASDGLRWFVAHTKPRREKKLAEYSLKNSINYYLPQKDSVRIYKYRKVKFTKPLFAGYIFIKCTLKQRDTLIITGHTAYFLHIPDEKELLEELMQIYSGRQKGAEFKETRFLEKGIRVKIISGPFQDLTGVVENQKDVTEVVLQVNLLRQAVSVSVSSDQVKVLK
ncbi:MAG: UpxY family transcription antiterminator [Candidatus Cloacimonetes bacterium]|nr:UpxY family transcription antiterminator [Candidatus Cloacimonadota bacterium]